MADNSKKAPATELYKIYSTVRDVSTRLKRVQSPTTHRFTMFLGGGLVRVIRKRPSVVTRSVLHKLIPELLEKEAKGMVKVTTMTGQRLDLMTMETTSEVVVQEPLPDPPMDSAAHDSSYLVGESKPALPGGIPETENMEPPAVIKRELPEGKDEAPDEEPAEDKPKTRRRGKRRV